jgi:hypothetical protein
MWKLKYLCSTTAIVDGLLNWQGYWQGVLSREEEIHVSILADEVPAVQLREDMKDTYKCLLDEDRGFLMKGNAAMSCCLDKVFLQTTMHIFCLLNTFQYTIHILSYGIRQCHRKSDCSDGNCCRTGFQLGLNNGGEDLSGMCISSVPLFVLITLNQQAICL